MQVSAGVLLCGKGFVWGSVRRWVPSRHWQGCAEQGGCPAALAQAVPLCPPPVPVPGGAECRVGDSCSGIPVGPKRTGGSQGVKGKVWRWDIPARYGEVTVPPTWVPGAGVTAGRIRHV